MVAGWGCANVRKTDVLTVERPRNRYFDVSLCVVLLIVLALLKRKFVQRKFKKNNNIIGVITCLVFRCQFPPFLHVSPHYIVYGVSANFLLFFQVFSFLDVSSLGTNFGHSLYVSIPYELSVLIFFSSNIVSVTCVISLFWSVVTLSSKFVQNKYKDNNNIIGS